MPKKRPNPKNLCSFTVDDISIQDYSQIETEYWPSHHQVFGIGGGGLMPTSAIGTKSGNAGEESLVPTLRKEVNSSIVTSAGQPVYLHCHVENLGERSVSDASSANITI